jgi:NAD(P)-dependent dehydrogenase (short-subunit alcohol dehydrogenase family)
MMAGATEFRCAKGGVREAAGKYATIPFIHCHFEQSLAAADLSREQGDKSMARKLEGKIAVVTGGTTGIGLATAKRFTAEGARVFVTGRRSPELDAAVAAIGPRATGIQADSVNLSDLNRLYERVKAEAGRIDVLFVNAGGGSMLPLGSITEEQYDDTFDRNVKGVLFTVQKALPLLVDRASVIITASNVSIKGTPAFSVYSASKAAVRNFARSWTLDLKARGIRVNVISPGPIKTPGLLDLAGPDPAQQQGLLDYMAATVPLGRVGDPDDVAGAAVFLASDDASFIAGTELFVDGGQAQI